MIIYTLECAKVLIPLIVVFNLSSFQMRPLLFTPTLPALTKEFFLMVSHAGMLLRRMLKKMRFLRQEISSHLTKEDAIFVLAP